MMGMRSLLCSILLKLFDSADELTNYFTLKAYRKTGIASKVSSAKHKAQSSHPTSLGVPPAGQCTK